MRQAKHQVVAYRRVADLPALVRHPLDVFKRLNAVDGLLHRRIVVLNPEAVSPEAQTVQHLQVRPGRVVGVRLKAQQRSFAQLRVREDALEQIAQMVRREKRRGAAPQVQFLDARRAVEQRPVTGPFRQDRLDVGRLHAVALGDVLVAPTKRAQRLAKRQVDVHADAFRGVGRRERLRHAGAPTGLRKRVRLPIRHRRVARVARSRDVVFPDEVLVEAHACPWCKRAKSSPKYVATRSAPARLKLSKDSSIAASSSTQPWAAAALIMAYSPLTW